MLVTTQPEAEGAKPSEADIAMAKQRAKAFLKSQNPKAAEIAKLKAKIAELEKQPSAAKAEAPVEGGGKKSEEMTFQEKIKAVLENHRENLEARKNKK
jgi:hypothetical protein